MNAVSKGHGGGVARSAPGYMHLDWTGVFGSQIGLAIKCVCHERLLEQEKEGLRLTVVSTCLNTT